MNVNERSQYLAGVHPAERFVTFFLLKRMTNIDRARSRAYVTHTHSSCTPRDIQTRVIYAHITHARTYTRARAQRQSVHARTPGIDCSR